jgi:activator of HSP90 ATPase
MTRAIEQSVRFSASARELYDLFLDPKGHAAFTGSPVKIGARAGSKFRAFNGMISGVTLLTVPGKLLVQRWRGHHWKDSELDSILVLEFVQEGKRGRINLVHVNVPAHDHAGVANGWGKYYWKPLARYLKNR